MKTRLAVAIINFATRILFLTLRKKIVVDSASVSYWQPNSNPGNAVVYAFWHGRLLFSFFMLRKLRPCAMLSRSRDGDILAGLLNNWGYSLVRGSSGTGANEVYAEALNVLRKEKSIAMTPDGSRGPYREAHSGAFRLAHEAKVPLIPVGVGFSSCWTLRSWDKFQIPKPFAIMNVVVGSPCVNPETLDKRTLAQLINNVTDSADRLSSN
jgi:lysophospholipid acyltransferase (LPLAT)-like uncharacterized protein